MKRVYEEAGGLVLRGDNPDFTPLRFSAEEAADVRSWARWWACTATWRAKRTDEALSRYLAPLKPGRGVLLWGEHLRPLAAAAAAWGVARGSTGLGSGCGQPLRSLRLVREARAGSSAPSRPCAGAGGPGLHLPPTGAPGGGDLPGGLDARLPGARPGTGEPVLRRTGALGGTPPPLPGPDHLLGRIKTQAALLLLQPLMPQAAGNRHFGRLLAPVIDYFVEVGNQEGVRTTGRQSRRSSAPPHVGSAPASLQKGDLKMNVYLSECQYLQSGPKFPARRKHWRPDPGPAAGRPDLSPGNHQDFWPPAP